MALSPASRVGPYEILSPLGTGGMGEVYRALDARLGREVAIKVLPPEVAADRDRLARFEREARSASALNHPNIVTIYEIGDADSISYISMELVQGTTLRGLLAEGPLPIKRLLALSVQIANGLARAHEAGIVHRDLKPENLMVAGDGLVKILDFGLAKVVSASGSGLSQLPTIAEPTMPGIVLGTVGYMSPEQAACRPAEFPSDQFSLGAILYEMATGKRAFARGSAAETMAAIIREEPEPLGALAPQIPPALRWIIERCLAKDPHERYASTRDLARDLAQLRDHVSEISQEASPIQTRRRAGWLWPAAAATLALVAAAALFFGARWRKEPALRTLRFSVPMPPGVESQRPLAVISPDGTRLAIEAVHEGRRRIYLRPLDSDKTIEVEGTLDAAGTFWSPDSRFLAFYSGGKLKKVAVAGGPPVELCTATLSGSGTWSRDGTILFPQRGDTLGICRVSDAGGQPIRVTTVAPSEDNHFWPCFLPDGRRFLYLVNRSPGSSLARELRLGSLDSKESRVVAHLDSRAEYVAPGYLAFVRERTLIAQPFDVRSGRLHGEPIPIVDGIHYFMGTGSAAFSFSENGILVYATGSPTSKITWFGRDGKVIGPLGPPSVIGAFRISPDGSRVAIHVSEPRTGAGDIWLFDRGRGIPTRLHSDPVGQSRPVWSPDGATLAYGSDRKGPPDIVTLGMMGDRGDEQPLFEGPAQEYPEDFSRDGRYLAFTSTSQWPNYDIWLLPLQGNGQPVPWLRSASSETSPRFSPDGRWIAYESDESGAPEVYVARTDAAGDKQRLSPAGGQKPRWRADGRELYYIGPGGLVMAVPVSPGAQFTAADLVPLFQVEVEDFDVTADGSQFLVSVPAEKSSESRIRVIVNWTSVLKGER
jgi:Tol biopolymer transport system component